MSAKTKRTLTWLHLSDLHARLRDEWDSATITRTLTEDLSLMQKEKGLRPDFICFTGDAAFAAHPNEYALARQFFDSVRQAFQPEIPVRQFYIVPGNHDVDRGEVTPDMTKFLRDSKTDFLKDILPPLRDNTKQWQNWMRRLHSYRTFVGDYCPHLAPADSHLIWADVQHVHGVPVGICGLNTAWSCVDDEDNGGLWFGTDWQIAQAKKRFTAAPAITFAMLHHPGNCLNAIESPTAMRRLQQEFHFVLHGHEHLQWPEPKLDGGIVISAGACYQSSWLNNGYSFGQIDFDTGARKLFLRRWDDKGRGWVEDNIAKKTRGGVYGLGKAKWAKVGAPVAKKADSSNPRPEAAARPTKNVDVKAISKTIGQTLSCLPEHNHNTVSKALLQFVIDFTFED